MTALQNPASMSGGTYRYLQEGLISFGRGLADLADRDDRIVVASADLIVSTLLIEFAQRHPDRTYQFGIAERNMVSAAAGMASTGLIPFVSTFGSFAALMCLEQIRTDLAYTGMPVRVVGTHSGLALGFLSTSHHATEDLSALRGIANLMVLSPADGPSAVALASATLDHPGPIYFRLGRGRDEGLYDRLPDDYRPGAPHVVSRGDELLIVATGIMVKRAKEAASLLADAGIRATVLDLHTVKPFPAEAVAELAADHEAVLTVEEHNVEGGIGTLTIEALFSHGVHRPAYKHGLLDEFSIIGPPNHLLEYYGLDPAGIATVAQRLLDWIAQGRQSNFEPLWKDEDRRAALESHGAAVR